jgi:hypothetical protein
LYGKGGKTNARALDVEMTAYALSVYNLKNDVLNGYQVLLWLGRQRNGNGGHWLLEAANFSMV